MSKTDIEKKGHHWHDDHREVIDTMDNLKNPTFKGDDKRAYDWIISLYDQYKQLQKENKALKEGLKEIRGYLDVNHYDFTKMAKDKVRELLNKER